MRIFAAAALLCFMSGAALADQAVLTGTLVPECELTIEFDSVASMLHYRTGSTGERCTISPEAAASGLRSALQRSANGPVLQSIFLGRLERLNWIDIARSAAQDKNWDGQAGRPRSGNMNTYVARLLMEKPIIGALSPLADELAAYGYRLVSASVEKVIVEDMWLAGLPSGRYPVDALVHLDIEKVP